jgi:hypothetical protein
MLLIAAHELMESITDPFVSAWYVGSGQEIADVCGAPHCVAFGNATLALPDIYSNSQQACIIH